MALIEPEHRTAFKEWAVVCRALGSGQQSLILRKGGIHEGRDGFRVAHNQFWLFPTQFHQQPDQVIPDARPLLDDVVRERPAEGEIPLQYYVVVDHVLQLQAESQFERLGSFHIWSEKTVRDRFFYRTPGLFALLVRVYRMPQMIRVADLPQFAGCRSWVEFPDGICTDGLVPVLSDDVHAERIQSLLEQIS